MFSSYGVIERCFVKYHLLVLQTRCLSASESSVRVNNLTLDTYKANFLDLRDGNSFLSSWDLCVLKISLLIFLTFSFVVPLSFAFLFAGMANISVTFRPRNPLC